MTDLLSDCDKGVRVALRAGAQAAEVFALRERGGSVEFEKGSVGPAEWEETAGFGVRVVREHRIGFAYATQAAEFKAAAQAALRAARLGQELRAFAFPGASKAPRIAGLHDPRIPEVGGEQLVGSARELLDAVADVRTDLLVAGGGVHAGEAELALANSEGLERHHAETGLGANCYVIQRRDGVSTGFATEDSTRRDVKPVHVGREAAELAVASAKPKPLGKAGRLPCLVRPESASDLFSTITVPSLFGKPAMRGETSYSEKKGKAVAHARFSLVEDPTRPRGLGSTPFDDEGNPTHVSRPIARGVLRSFFFDTYDAALFGEKTTSNAVRSSGLEGRSYKGTPGTSALQLRIEAPTAKTDKLVASMDRGLVVHDLMGVHTANTVSGDFSVNSSVLFEVRKGAVVGPVAPVSIAGNLHQALRREIRIGDDVKPLGGSPAWSLPSVLFEDFTVTP